MIRATIDGQIYNDVTKVTATDEDRTVLKEVNIEEVGTIPVPTESIEIERNGTVDVTNFASAIVNVAGGESSGGLTVLYEGEVTLSSDVTGSGTTSLGSVSTGITEEIPLNHLVVLHSELIERTGEGDMPSAYMKSALSLAWPYENRTYKQIQNTFYRAYRDGGDFLACGGKMGIFLESLSKVPSNISLSVSSNSTYTVCAGRYRVRLIDTGIVV